jgi:hypothetical protein
LNAKGSVIVIVHVFLHLLFCGGSEYSSYVSYIT